MMRRSNALIPAGAVIGVALAFGRLPFLAGAATGLARTASEVTVHVTNWVTGLVSDQPSRWTETTALVVGLVSPGLTALLLALAARAGIGLRRGIGGLIVVIGLLSFAVLPRAEAAGVFTVCVALGAAAIVGLDVLVVVPCAAVAAMLAVLWSRDVLASHTATNIGEVTQMHALWFPDQPGLFLSKVVVIAIVFLPFLATLVLLIRDLYKPADV